MSKSGNLIKLMEAGVPEVGTALMASDYEGIKAGAKVQYITHNGVTKVSAMGTVKYITLVNVDPAVVLNHILKVEDTPIYDNMDKEFAKVQ